MGHANKDVTDKYAEQLKDDVEYRQEWAEKIGLGFELGPKVGTSGTGPNQPRLVRSRVRRKMLQF
jgi:hypothetical protein